MITIMLFYRPACAAQRPTYAAPLTRVLLL